MQHLTGESTKHMEKHAESDVFVVGVVFEETNIRQHQPYYNTT